MEGRARERADEEATGREELLAVLAALTETRLHRPAGREGWTLRHALGAVAAADRVLAHVLASLAADPGTPARFRLRRLRGEVMYEAHMLQRDALGRLLRQTHAEAEGALAAHAALLGRTIEVEDGASWSVGELIADRAGRERTALRALREALPPDRGPRAPGGGRTA